MQKKIIVLAIASALTAPALAFADVTVYGQANLSVDMVKDGMAPSATDYQLNSNTSRIGVKGSEDIGSGVSAIAQLEGTVTMDSPANSSNGVGLTFDRDTFLGLSSATAGTLVLGQHDTPYKMATRNLDMFADGIADNRGNQSTSPTFSGTTMMGGGHDATSGNLIAYISPSMSGFSVAAATVFGAESAAANTTKGSAYSLAGMYVQGPFYGALAYDNSKAGDAGTGDLGGTVNDKDTAFKLGGSYTVDAFAVNAVIERLTSTPAVGTERTNTNYYLAGKFNISSTDDVKLAYTKRGSQSGLTNDANQVSVGYDHSMSRNTTVYALGTKLTDNTTGGADPSAVSFGIRHSF